MIQHALSLAARGFAVFPITPNAKEPPRFKEFWKYATTDSGILKRYWAYDPGANPGILCRDHLGVDIDVKDNQPGLASLAALPPLPATYWQRTPSGGFHFLFRLPEGVVLGNTHHRLGRGIDTRGHHGYVLGAGSTLPGGEYTGAGNDPSTPVAACPTWLLDRLLAHKAAGHEDKVKHEVNQTAAVLRGIAYLQSLDPAVPGTRGISCYKAACVLRGFGLDLPECAFIIMEHFKADPPPPPEELETAVRNAYKYAQGTQGDAAAETVFARAGEVPPPSGAEGGKSVGWFEKLNSRFAFCEVGGASMILHETTDAKGRPKTKVIPLATFHNKLKPLKVDVGNERKSASHLWMEDHERREYEDLVFLPGKTVPSQFYNLWRGFSVEPLARGEALTPIMQRGMDAFLEHTLNNFCAGDKRHHQWLMGWYAHMIQKPWEKPLVALVVRGMKGCGKDTPTNIVGSLVRSHFISTAKKRYLVGDFNGHMQNILLFSLNEAFWAYDPTVKAVMNDLITNDTHFIERKGCEPYEADNYLRVVLLGNADQTVPVSYDERRYTIFNCGNGHLRDKKFFETMRLDMAGGGARALLRFFLDFDLATVDINEPLDTQGLHDQKLGNLDTVHEWWRQCLATGWIIGGGLGSTTWDERADKESVRSSYRRWREENEKPGKLCSADAFGRRIKECCPSIDGTQARYETKIKINQYAIPPLEQCIREWNVFIKFEDIKL